MADHGHHDPGGHELEAINTKLLFRLMISLSLVTLLAAIAVIQWFYSQRRELEGRYAAEGSFQLTDYKTRMGAELEGIDRVAADMVAKPAMLVAPPPPSGWIHPDDLLGGGAAAAPAAPAEHGEHAAPSEPAEPAEDDAEGEGAEGDVPANVGDQGLDPEPAPEPADAPVEVTPGDKPGKPANDKPAKPENEKPGKPESDKPKANNGKGDENKADKADKPDDNG